MFKNCLYKILNIPTLNFFNNYKVFSTNLFIILLKFVYCFIQLWAEYFIKDSITFLKILEDLEIFNLLLY